MQKFFLALTILSLLFPGMSARAAEPVQVSAVSINLWPEYDQAAVLVIYHLTLAPDTPLPATVPVRIPAQVDPSAVAVLDPASGLINAPYEQTQDGKWNLLLIDASSLQVQVEYYDLLPRSGTRREIRFEWLSEYTPGSIEINFLEPAGSRNLSIDPAPVQSLPGENGLTNHVIWSTALAAGEPFVVNIRYDRESDQLGIASLPVEAVTSPGADTPGRVSMLETLPWLLGGLGVLLLAAGGVIFYSWQRGEHGRHRSRRHTSASKATVSENVYCPQCGKRAAPGDTFCRTCGARLRQDG